MLSNLNIPHDFPSVAEQEQGESLLVLSTFDDYDTGGELAGLVMRRLSEGYKTFGIAERIFEVVAEVCNNAVEHAGSHRAFAVAQVYAAGTTSQRIDLAVSDSGRGARASLQAGGYDVDDDVRGLELALESEVTASGMPGRGNGLPDAIDLMTQVGGTVAVRSNAAWAVFGLEHQPPAHTIRVPGTVVGATVPCGVADRTEEAPGW